MIRFFVLSFEDNVIKTDYAGYLQCYDQWKKNFFDQPVKNDLKTYDKIRKIAIGQGEYYTTGCLLDYSYLKKTQDDSNTFK